MKLRQDPLHPDVWVLYDDNGDIEATGRLELAEDGSVVFVRDA